MKKHIIVTALLLFSFSTLMAQFPTKCLIAHYPMDRNANDVTRYQNHGKVQGATLTKDRFGRDSMAYEFDGNDYILIKDDSILNPVQELTVSAWFKTGNSFNGTGNNVIVSKRYKQHSAPYYQYHLSINPDKHSNGARFGADITTSSIRSHIVTNSGFWKENTWYFLCMTYDNKYLKLYVDAKLEAKTQKTGNINNFRQDLVIGAFGHNLPNGTPGVIDDVRIYRCALDTSQINNLYNEGNPSTSVNLLSGPEVKVYPNPVIENLYIQLPFDDSWIITIYDVTGRIRYSGYYDGNPLSFSNLDAGIYYLSMRNENKFLVNKTIIKL